MAHVASKIGRWEGVQFARSIVRITVATLAVGAVLVAALAVIASTRADDTLPPLPPVQVFETQDAPDHNANEQVSGCDPQTLGVDPEFALFDSASTAPVWIVPVGDGAEESARAVCAGLTQRFDLPIHMTAEFQLAKRAWDPARKQFDAWLLIQALYHRFPSAIIPGMNVLLVVDEAIDPPSGDDRVHPPTFSLVFGDDQARAPDWNLRSMSIVSTYELGAPGQARARAIESAAILLARDRYGLGGDPASEAFVEPMEDARDIDRQSRDDVCNHLPAVRARVPDRLRELRCPQGVGGKSKRSGNMFAASYDR